MKTLKLVFLLLLAAGCQSTESYDLVLRNATIIDGTGEPSFRGDLAVNADTIAFVGNLKGKKGKVDLDLNGLVLTPGFINMLSWANVSLLEDGRSQSDLRQGVTLEVLGEGTSMGPLSEDMKKEMLEGQGDIQYDITWTTLGEYLQHLENKGVSTNVASFVGNGTLRRHVIGMENRKATPEEMAQMKKLLEAEMKAGAVGLSSSLLYEPSRYADTEELIELSKVAAQHGGMYISHIRNEGSKLLESIAELITIGQTAKIPAQIYHLKASGEENWGKMDSAIAMVNAAREAGLPITADMYTYPASSTGLHTQMPEWAREGGVEALLGRLADPEEQSKILEEIKFGHGPDKIHFVGFKNPDLRKYIGKNLAEVAETQAKSPAQTMIDLMLEDQSRIQVVYFSMSEENVEKIIQQPWVSFCSDAGSYTNEGVFLNQSTHPRAYGSFARVLGLYSREKKLLSLEEAVRRLSSFPAQTLKIKKRGLLKAGYFADLVVFDPEKVRDKATFEQPHQYAEGIIHVFVNGQQVLNNGEHTGNFPGRFVKGPGTQ
ncbi:N-acyl-D-amino-acid deacylase family protein [Pararhodonellum marinum]|uniref:N-acyl-D-amino-acid deacylase family protein n=1 Tax=Pararhodonellum marinum TaxID=2755358 RepID=UPI00188F8A1E|nr:D-aminoacylase [Pararhodonellum marinum]